MQDRKKRESKQLGMNKSTAHQRLVKDILFKLAVDAGHKCYRCEGELSRDTLSIEHKEDWYNSSDAAKLYFDLDNIAFSHNICNTKAGAKKTRRSPEERKAVIAANRKKNYDPVKRKDKYEASK